MSAVVENEVERRPRSKLETLARTLDERQTEIATMQEQVVRLRQEEEQAVAEAARSAPTRRIFAVGSPVERIRRRREKIEASLPDRQREAEALRLALDEVAAEHADEELAEACARLRASEGRQRAHWQRAGELLVELAAVWAALAVEINEVDDEAGRALASDPYRLGSAQAKAELDQAVSATVALVEPCPPNLAAFVRRLLEAAVSDSNRLPDLTELTIAGEPVQVPTQAVYLDQRRVLRELGLDLRAAPTVRPSRRIELLGGGPRREML